MQPRVAGIVAFLATALTINLWGGRRDKAAHAAFEVSTPPGFVELDRQMAALAVGDDSAAKTSSLAQGGSAFAHFGENEEDAKYTEIVEVSEDIYPLRPGSADRIAMFGQPVIELGPQPLRVVDSRVVQIGGHEVVVGRLEATVGGQPVRLTRYVLASDKGRATVDTFSLVSEEAKYRPIFDAMIGGARGVAYRPPKPEPGFIGLLSLLAGAVVYLLTRQLAAPAKVVAKRVPERRDDQDEDDERA